MKKKIDFVKYELVQSFKELSQLSVDCIANKEINDVLYIVTMEELYTNIESISTIKLMETYNKIWFIVKNEQKIFLKNENSGNIFFNFIEIQYLFLDFILTNTFDKLLNLSLTNLENITPSNIPQFSSFNSGTIDLVKKLLDSGNYGSDFIKLGKYLTNSKKNDVAYRKYGENHAKLGTILGLSFIDTTSRPNQIFLTELGKIFYSLTKEKQVEYIIKMCIRIPLIKTTMKTAMYEKVKITELLDSYLSGTTIKRRLPNIMYFFEYMHNHLQNDILMNLFNNIER